MVFNADNLVREYSSTRYTSTWPLRVFMDMLDIGALNTIMIWILKTKNWNHHLKDRRYRFLLNELTKPNILHRVSNSNGLHLPVVRVFEAARIFVAPKLHHQHQGSRRAIKGQYVSIVLETTIRKSAQSAINANVLSAMHIGRPAQLWPALRPEAIAKYESVPFILVKLYSCFFLYRIQSE